jgi:hypothetical protein
MLGTFNKTKIKKGSYWISLVIDIRSSSIGASLVKNFKGKNKVPVILETYREQIFYTERPKSAEFIQRSHYTLNRVLNEIMSKKHDPLPLRNTYVFYGSPWYKNEIKKLKHVEKKITVASEQYLKKIIRETFIDTNKKELVEQKCISVKLNGYKTKNPIDKKFKEIEIEFYESILHQDTHDEITKIVNSYTQGQPVHHRTHPLTVFEVISKKFEPIDNYTIIDISGEITELTVVKKDEIKVTASVPHGSHFFVRGLSKKCNLDFLNSFSKLDLILNAEVDEHCEKDSIKAFAEMKVEWATEIREALVDSKIRAIPSNVFVLVDKEVTKLTRNILNEPEIYFGALKFKKKPNLFFINSHEIENLCVYRNSVRKDSILSLEANYVELSE